jgi:mannose-6-phosphate isomerase-like protein (cupin superfamily)
VNRGRRFDAAEGERQTIRVDSRTTGGAYAIIESVAAPGCAVPTHLHRNEDEHFLIISGRYRIAVDDELFDATPGTRITVPPQFAAQLEERQPGGKQAAGHPHTGRV